jgi:hypothetical protein
MKRTVGATLVTLSLLSLATSAHPEEKATADQPWSFSTIASSHEAKAAFDFRKGHRGRYGSPNLAHHRRRR